MKLIYKGKTKNIYVLEDNNYLMKFKDDATGEDGVFDPGSNSVGLTIEGMGRGGLRLTEYYFKLLSEAGILTHYISSDVSKAEMKVKPATIFGWGLEVVCRYRAVGSFKRRYSMYVEEGRPLDGLVEITLKDDDRGDPPITKDSLVELKILSADEFEELKAAAKKISGIVKADLAKKGMDLYDIKFEFGKIDGKIALIDEISGGCMRVYKDGNVVDPLELVKLVLD